MHADLKGRLSTSTTSIDLRTLLLLSHQGEQLPWSACICRNFKMSVFASQRWPLRSVTAFTALFMFHSVVLLRHRLCCLRGLVTALSMARHVTVHHSSAVLMHPCCVTSQAWQMLTGTGRELCRRGCREGHEKAGSACYPSQDSAASTRQHCTADCHPPGPS